MPTLFMELLSAELNMSNFDNHPIGTNWKRKIKFTINLLLKLCTYNNIK